MTRRGRVHRGSAREKVGRRPGARSTRVSLRGRGAVTLAALTVLVAGACSDSSSWSITSEPAGVGAEVAVQESGGATLFERMRQAPNATAFRGTRRVVLERSGEVYEFVEEVGADGSGRFAVEVPAAGVRRLPAGLDPMLAPLFLEQRGAFAHRVREPRIVDLALFATHWNMRILSRSVTVAGHPCWRMEIERKQPLTADPTRYELDVEPRTGFVLAWRETTLSGQPVSRVEFETLEFDADVSDMDLVDRAFPVNALDPFLDLETQVGAEVRRPDLAPPGFELEAVELLEPSPGVEWIKFVYTDGLERAFFLHRIDRSGGPLTQPGPSRVDHAPFGPWTFAVGEVNGLEVVAAGKVPAVYVGDLIESAVH